MLLNRRIRGSGCQVNTAANPTDLNLYVLTTLTPTTPRSLKVYVLVDRKSEDNDGEETWQFNHRYWEVRKTPGFVSLNIEPLW